jgi:competence protein ComEC
MLVQQAVAAMLRRVDLAGWVEAERGRFVLWLPVLLGAGVAGYFALRWQPAWWCGPAALAARIGLIAATSVALGFAAAQLATLRAAPPAVLPTRAVVLMGTLRSIDPMPQGRRITLVDVRLGDAAAPLARFIRVRLRDGDPAVLAEGDSVTLRALLRPPSPPSYPGAWDLQRDAFFAGQAGSGFALGEVQVLAHAAPHGLAARIDGLRDAVQRRVLAALPGPAGGIAATLLTGNAAAIPPADRAAFRDSGLAHLLAVAGLHIGIVMGLVFGLTRLLLAAWELAALHWPTRQIAALTAWAAGLGYMVLTGMHVPIQRSFAMACLVTLGLLAGRRAVSLRGLALAAAALLLATPQALTGVSFQMSFSAVLALIAGYEALRPVLTRLHGRSVARRAALHIAMLALTSLLAGTASAPFAAYHFGHVQIYFILANLLAVPLTAAWVMPWGLAALALMPAGLERLALAPMGWGVQAVLWIGRTVSALPAATLDVPHPPLWGLLTVSLGIAWVGLWRTRLRLAGVPAILAGLVSPTLVTPPDLLVSADARLIALRTPAGLVVQSLPGDGSFTLDAWRQVFADGRVAPFPTRGDAPGATCQPGACLLRPQPAAAAAVLVRQRDAAPACGSAAVLISAAPARSPCAAMPLVDRFTVWRDGAQAIWLTGGGATILSDRAVRGDRPWVPPPPAPQPRTIVALPLAATE